MEKKSSFEMSSKWHKRKQRLMKGRFKGDNKVKTRVATQSPWCNSGARQRQYVLTKFMI